MKVLLLLTMAAVSLFGQVKLPRYTRHVLANGVVLNIMPKHDVPLVTIRVDVRGGTESDPARLSGLASVTADSLRRGTQNRSADQFSSELDSLGATFATFTDTESSSINMECLSKDLDKAWTLLLDVIAHPAFPNAEITKMIAQRVDRAKATKDNPAAAAAEYYRSFFYGTNHPYGHPADELSLSRIQRQDIVDYHKRMYVGRNLVVGVVGDVDPGKVAAILSPALSAIPQGRAYQWKQIDAASKPVAKIAVIEKPDATQTNFLIGRPGISRTNPDRTALWLVNTIFGGRFTSMLNDELRVNSGLTYGARSHVDEHHLPGAIALLSFTKTDTTGKAIDLAVEMLRRLHEKGITEEQLASAKAYIKGAYPSERLETSDQLADVLADIELYDLNRSEIDALFARIDAVTLEDANRVAKRYYGTDGLTFVVLGNANQFAAEMNKYGAGLVRVPISSPGFGIPQPAAGTSARQ